MFKSFLWLCLGATMLLSCSDDTPAPVVEKDPNEGLPIAQGVWQISMDLGHETLPFNIDLKYVEDHYELTVMNSEELIAVDDVSIENDSIFIRMPFFDSEFKGKITSNKEFTGKWFNFQ